jgi:VIT1/CCC1 family predicted Fe2+/Mn2+ transporter
MKTPMAVPDNDRHLVPAPEPPPSWPDLFGRLIMDFTKVLEAEARLVRASIEPTLSSVLEKWLTQLVIAALVLLGCLLLVVAAILLVHLWLALWLSFAVVGGTTLLLAVCGLLVT